jgi:hypothetical protein
MGNKLRSDLKVKYETKKFHITFYSESKGLCEPLNFTK